MGEEKKPIYKKWWFWVIGVVVVIAIASQAGGGGKDEGSSSATSTSSSENAAPAETAPEPAPEPVITVTAKEYYSSYESNELAADKKFEDKKLEITGVVEAVESTMGTVYVNLKADEYFASVRCKLDDDSGAENLSKGSTVTLIGYGDGKMASMGSPRVRECRIK